MLWKKVKNGIDLEDAHNHAFEAVCRAIQINVLTNKNIMKLIDPNATYISALENTKYTNPNRVEKLKARLQKEILGELIDFAGSGMFGSKLVYNKEISTRTAVAMAFKLGTADGLSDLAAILREAILSAFKTSEELPWPSIADYFQTLQSVVPSRVEKFLRLVLFLLFVRCCKLCSLHHYVFCVFDQHR